MKKVALVVILLIAGFFAIADSNEQTVTLPSPWVSTNSISTIQYEVTGVNEGYYKIKASAIKSNTTGNTNVLIKVRQSIDAWLTVTPRNQLDFIKTSLLLQGYFAQFGITNFDDIAVFENLPTTKYVETEMVKGAALTIATPFVLEALR